MSRGIGVIVLTIVLSIVAGVLGGFLAAEYEFTHLTPAHTATSTSSSSQPPQTPFYSTSATLPTTVAPLVEKVRPAVVHISTISYVRQFDLFMGYRVYPERGIGSGFFISPDGYIVTNRHVVVGTASVTVKLEDGSEYPAKVVGMDKLSDIAVLKIDAPGKSFPYLEFGDASKVRVGDFVIAVGNPYGFDYTVTFGIISAKERTIREENGVMIYDVLQTDAAINPGNSGGPLVTMDGRVVGINTAIYSEGQGIGFAVSANTAKRVVDDIIKYGHARWPYIGVGIRDLDEELAASLGIPFVGGVYVVKVYPGTPASDAGIKPGDVILSVDGRQVRSADELMRLLRQHYSPGDKVTLKIYRDGKKIDISFKLGEMPSNWP